MKKLTPVFLAVVLATGCASIQTVAIHITDPRAAVPVSSVALVQQVPPGSILIADLFASGANTPCGAQAAQADMKKTAAAVGANMLVVESWNANNYGLGVVDKFRVEGHAYFAPPVSK